jgi:acetoin utilization deacetylase AcuC-like enzyme
METPRVGKRLLPRWPWRRRRAELVYSEKYDFSLPATPLDPGRAGKILGALESAGLVKRGGVVLPAQASVQELLRVHEEEYLESIARPESLLPVFGFAPTSHQHERALEVQRWMTGGTVTAARGAVASGRVAVNLGGGLHHAYPDRGQGFCIFNDVAVAVRALREEGFEGRVLVVDLDLHDGDGTRAVFAEDPGVHTFSIHNRHRGDPRALEATSVELGSGIEDERYLAVLGTALPPVLESYGPDLVFYLAGTDVAADDPLGDWKLSAHGLLQRDRHVLESVRQRARPIPLVVLLAGGYGDETWRYSARFLSLVVSGRVVEPPSTDEVLLARFRAVSRLLRPAELRQEAGDAESWGLTQEDLTGALHRGGDHRFLGYYSRHGIELALERSGLFERLRDLGFPRPEVGLDLDQPAGHTLRIWGDADHRELLCEARLRRDRQSLGGMELLAVEWLMLQNPRLTFAEQRPALPGQQHPGLGLLRETMALLVTVCERLGLDGLLFTPAHYHLAAKGQNYLRFLDPRDAGLFESLQRAVEELPLDQASRAVERGGVVDRARGEPFRWRAMPMVLPVSDRLRERFEEASYRAEAATSAAEHSFERRDVRG